MAQERKKMATKAELENTLDSVESLLDEALLSKRIAPTHPVSIQRAAFDAIVQDGLATYRQRKAVAEHAANISSVVSSPWRYLPLPEEEKAKAREEVEKAISRLPVGTSRLALEVAANEAIEPIRKRVAEEEKIKSDRRIAMIQEEVSKRAEKVRVALKVSVAIGHISTYLNREYTFETVYDRWAEEKRLRELLQPEVESLVTSGEVEDAKDYVESRIDEEQAGEDDDADDDDDDEADDDDDEW